MWLTEYMQLRSHKARKIPFNFYDYPKKNKNILRKISPRIPYLTEQLLQDWDQTNVLRIRYNVQTERVKFLKFTKKYLQYCPSFFCFVSFCFVKGVREKRFYENDKTVWWAPETVMEMFAPVFWTLFSFKPKHLLKFPNFEQLTLNLPRSITKS